MKLKVGDKVAHIVHPNYVGTITELADNDEFIMVKWNNIKHPALLAVPSYNLKVILSPLDILLLTLED